MRIADTARTALVTALLAVPTLVALTTTLDVSAAHAAGAAAAGPATTVAGAGVLTDPADGDTGPTDSNPWD